MQNVSHIRISDLDTTEKYLPVNIAHPNLTVVYLMVAERAYFYTLEDLQSVLKQTKNLVY